MVSPCWGVWLLSSWRWAASVVRPPGLTRRPELHRGSPRCPDAGVLQTTELCTGRHGYATVNDNQTQEVTSAGKEGGAEGSVTPAADVVLFDDVTLNFDLVTKQELKLYS